MSKDKAMASPFKDPERRRQYHQQYHKEKWYPLHKEERMKRSKQQRQDLVKWYQEYKKTLKCADCGQNHPATLEFHHLDPAQKEVNVSRLIADSTSMRKLKEEIAKCVVLCANCHRIRHWNERQGNTEEPGDDLMN
jgi:transcription elongation factor Elf1